MSLSLYLSRARARLAANTLQLLLPLSKEVLQTASTQNNIFREKKINI
jgi:hypothetical protein